MSAKQSDRTLLNGWALKSVTFTVDAKKDGLEDPTHTLHPLDAALVNSWSRPGQGYLQRTRLTKHVEAVS